MRIEHASVYLLFFVWSRAASEPLAQNDQGRQKDQGLGIFRNKVGDQQIRQIPAEQIDDQHKLALENVQNNQESRNENRPEVKSRNNQDILQGPGPVGQASDVNNHHIGLENQKIPKGKKLQPKSVLKKSLRKEIHEGRHKAKGASEKKIDQTDGPGVEVKIKEKIYNSNVHSDNHLHKDAQKETQNDVHLHAKQDIKDGAHVGTGDQKPKEADIPGARRNVELPSEIRERAHPPKQDIVAEAEGQEELRKRQLEASRRLAIKDRLEKDRYQQDQERQRKQYEEEHLRQEAEKQRRQSALEQEHKLQEDFLKETRQREQYRPTHGNQAEQPRQQEKQQQPQLEQQQQPQQARQQQPRQEHQQPQQEQQQQLRQEQQQQLQQEEQQQQPRQEQQQQLRQEQQQEVDAQQEDASLQRDKKENLDLGGGGGKQFGDGAGTRGNLMKQDNEPVAPAQVYLGDTNGGRFDQNIRDPGVDEHQQQQSNNPNEAVSSIGRGDVKWDGDDFALVFGDSVYMEQKIRRASVPTSGAPWPKPQYVKERKGRVYRIQPNFAFNISEKSCDIIEKAVQRYRTIVLKYSLRDMHDNLEFAKGSDFEPEHLKYSGPPFSNASSLKVMSVRIRTPCKKLYPSEKMDESYTLIVKKTRMYIASNEVWGALRGLETFSQLVFKGTDNRLYIREVLVNDYPRFAHRGVLIDTSRHYIYKEVLYDALEGMAQNKLNLMHWHIVDDQSFPFESQAFPKLSKKGAFNADMVYTKKDIEDVIEYARLRGIRVVPEFDTPGHTYSWGLGYPDLLTQCYSGPYPINGYLGPINPASNYSYDFLRTFFREVLTVFKDRYVHLGGDEVPLSCWVSNPSILSFSEKIGAYGDTRKLMEYYETKLLKILEDLAAKKHSGVRTVVWQDVIDTVDQLPERVIIHVWKGGMPDVQRATSMGHHVIYSTCWYLDLIEYGSRWYKYYLCDPTDSSSGYIDERLVLGGEAALWAEYIDNENLMTTLWPRASATAERLWSHKDQRDVQEAGRRLIEHRCRMLGRGLGVAQISGPDYCPSRGPRKLKSASRLMEEETNEVESKVTVPPKKNVLIDSRIDLIDLRIGGAPRTGTKGSDCGSWATRNSVISQGNGWVLLFLTLIVLAAIFFQIRSNGGGYSTHRILKNKTILFSFLTLLVIYITCYTTLWLQVLDVKRSSFLKVEGSPTEPNGGNVFKS